MTLAQLTELFGWISVLNIGFLFFASLLLITMKPIIAPIHSKMFGIDESDLTPIYFNYLAHYKTLSFIFIIAPYIALKIMGF